MWKVATIWKALVIAAVADRALSAWTETQCTEKALSLGIGLLTDPPCENFMEAVMALGETNCTQIAEEHRQRCYDTYAPTFGEYLANCASFYSDDEDVSSQSVDESYDPCFTTEQYIEIYSNALRGSDDEGSTNDKELECARELLSLHGRAAEDPDCSTFFDSFDADTCEIAEENREDCWDSFGEKMLGLMAKCYEVVEEEEFDQMSFEETLQKDGPKSACYDEEKIRARAIAIAKEMNGTPSHGASLLLTTLLAVVVFCVLLL